MRLLTVVPTTILISAVLAGCASKETIIPTPAQDMQAVYREHMQGVGGVKLWDSRALVRRSMIEGDVALSDYVRTEKTQLEAKFTHVPHPTLYMFVAPHLASETKVPIPGYLTQFRMWERDHYALPGEVSDMKGHYKGR